MPGGRRGLVAPQNTFLDNLIKRANAQPDTTFILANAQIIHFPIVYCSDEFTKLLGYPKVDVMQKSANCEFMMGALTDSATLDKMIRTMENHKPGCFELLFYKKTGQGVWLQVDITPIKNDKCVIVLLLITFRDITAFKEPLDGAGDMMSNLSKFAKLAWTMTRSRNVNFSSNRNNQSTAGSSNSMTLVGKNNYRGDKLIGSKDNNHDEESGRNPHTQRCDLLRPAFLESLPDYRHNPPKTPPHILLHYSPFKVAWDWIILALTFYTVVMVPYNLAINRAFNHEDITLLVVDSIVDVIFFIDIVFNFHTSFVGNDGSVIVDQDKIRRNYLRSGFVIDIMACLPYDALNVFDTRRDGNSGYGNIFSILKVMRLFRLGRVARALHRFLESSFALLLLMLSFYMIVAHWFACIFYVIGREDLKSGTMYGWLSSLANQTNSPFILMLDKYNETVISGGPSQQSMYLTALYFTMTCMTSIGFGNVAAETDSEKAFTCVMMMISSLLYAAIFGHVTTIIHNLTLATAKYHEMLHSVKEFMYLNQVPKNLCERVVDYVVSKWANTKGVDQDKVLSVCPKDMRADICVHLNRRVFNECPAFRLASDGCLRALAVNFEMLHCAPGDFIFRKGESIRELSFVVAGSLEVIQDGEILAFLSAGDVFGDAQWKNHTLAKSAVHVRALTYSDIHMINVEKLKDVLEFYKAFAQTFARNLTLTVDLSKRTVFNRMSERKFEKAMQEIQQYEQPFTPAQVLLLKKAVNKFKDQLTDNRSSTNESLTNNNNNNNNNNNLVFNNATASASPQALRERLINRLSNSRSISQVGNLMEPSSSGKAINLVDAANKNRSKSSVDNKWKLVRQKSQQMIQSLAGSGSSGAAAATTATSAAPSTGQQNDEANKAKGSTSVQIHYHSSNSPVQQQPSQSQQQQLQQQPMQHLMTSSIMHDFNLSMSEYRSEIRENIAQLDTKISKLEEALSNLNEQIPNLIKLAEQGAKK